MVKYIVQIAAIGAALIVWIKLSVWLDGGSNDDGGLSFRSKKY